jgi:zinc/manganese transport system permease protein
VNAADWGLLATPFAAGLLVLATHVPLGIEVLRRNIIFLDLAVAQVAALGVIGAELLGWESAWAVQIAAATAAVAGALLITMTEKRWPRLQEALIGLMFVIAASAGILLLSGNAHAGERLRDLLGGQILWVGWERLWPVAVLYCLLLAAWFGWRERLGRAGFYLVFALAVTASVQLVGVFLVFASLIAPAVASHALGRRRLAGAWGLGTLGYAAGLMLSLAADLPAGPAIVCCLGAVAFGALLFARPVTR